MTRTPTLPADDPKMWRQLIARTHPDSGGEHELFIWTQNVREHVCSGTQNYKTPPSAASRKEPRIVHEDGRVPFPRPADFETLTRRALEVADEADGIFLGPLCQLRDCQPMAYLAHEQERGASYTAVCNDIGPPWLSAHGPLGLRT